MSRNIHPSDFQTYQRVSELSGYKIDCRGSHFTIIFPYSVQAISFPTFRAALIHLINLVNSSLERVQVCENCQEPFETIHKEKVCPDCQSELEDMFVTELENRKEGF